MTLEALHRTRSMSETARQIGRTQPAISQQIDAVEDAVGFQVLHHRRGGVHFTARGEQLVQAANALLDAFEQRVDALRQMPDERLRVGIPEDLWLTCKTWLDPLAERDIEIVSMTSHNVLQAFEAGEIDLGIAATTQPLQQATRTWRLDLGWAGCSPLSTRRGDIRLVSLPRGCLYSALAMAAVQSAPFRVERHLIFDNLDEMFCELKNGGITIMSAQLTASLGHWHDETQLPALPKANLNLLVRETGQDYLAWAASTLAGGISRALRQRERDPIAGMLKDLGVDLRFHSPA
nr:LysR family transcriptional regulator [Rhodovibrio salinarum]